LFCLKLRSSRYSQSSIQGEVRKSLLNVFLQAYVGGLYREQGLDVVREWLRSFLLLDVKEAYEIIREEYLLPPL